jgi:hypothetical protein
MGWTRRRSLPGGRACGYDPRADGSQVRRLRPPSIRYRNAGGCRDLGRLAQWLEHTVHIRGVTGSNPVSPTIDTATDCRAHGPCFCFRTRPITTPVGADVRAPDAARELLPRSSECGHSRPDRRAHGLDVSRARAAAQRAAATIVSVNRESPKAAPSQQEHRDSEWDAGQQERQLEPRPQRKRKRCRCQAQPTSPASTMPEADRGLPSPGHRRRSARRRTSPSQSSRSARAARRALETPTASTATARRAQGVRA